jgi:hypothetical protein
MLSLTHEIDFAWSGLKISKFYRECMGSLVFLPPCNLKADISETIACIAKELEIS